VGEITEIGRAILSQAEQRLEVVAQNIANISTPGYKTRRPFSDLVGESGAQDRLTNGSLSVDFANAKKIRTDDPLNIAIEGPGFFTLRAGDDTYFSRNGQFNRDADGRLILGDHMVLQGDGGDVIVKGALSVSTDGVVLDDGTPVARLSISQINEPDKLQPLANGIFGAGTALSQPAAGALVRQGMLETSNVSSANEMLSMMAAVRQAEAGQRLMQLYDDLTGRAITAFGQA
jgi:flagellar basal-body rod protein FlgF